jgi:protein-S-isoprenylcysteine O-methyltransferase Ste14
MKAGYIIKQFLGSLIFFLVLFVSAGRVDYWQGLIYLILGLIMFILNYTAFKPDPDLLAERSNTVAGSKKWDKLILGLSFLTTLGMFITAGLDSGRFHWSPDYHWSLILAGIFLTATGQLLFIIAQKQNKFFSSIVRIQTERGHTVCDTGLYKIVRHPAYLGSIIQASGFPLITGSLWSIFPAIILIILHFFRTYFEDKTLKEELDGYKEYSDYTRYKIIPYLW